MSADESGSKKRKQEGSENGSEAKKIKSTAQNVSILTHYRIEPLEELSV